MKERVIHGGCIDEAGWERKRILLFRPEKTFRRFWDGLGREEGSFIGDRVPIRTSSHACKMSWNCCGRSAKKNGKPCFDWLSPSPIQISSLLSARGTGYKNCWKWFHFLTCARKSKMGILEERRMETAELASLQGSLSLYSFPPLSFLRPRHYYFLSSSESGGLKATWPEYSEDRAR